MASEDDIDMSRDDLYEIVGCERTATREEIRRAYRRKARQLHPDVTGDPNSAKAFRRLVAAFETIMDESKRGAYETQRKRSSARSRAEAAWENMNKRASYSSPPPPPRPAGSRREAEARTREESEKRRMRWREIQYEEIFREHMPLDYSASSADRAAFVAELELAVQRFTRREATTEGFSNAGATRSSSSYSAEELSEELSQILKLTNREVLRAELTDAKHRSQRHRERARWLEGELLMAQNKAAGWRGATPSTEGDRVMFMQRELDFLQLSNRLSDRLNDQRTAVQLLRKREKAIETRLATLKEEG